MKEKYCPILDREDLHVGLNLMLSSKLKHLLSYFHAYHEQKGSRNISLGIDLPITSSDACCKAGRLHHQSRRLELDICFRYRHIASLRKIEKRIR
jgi:hypothetical protein